MVLEEVGISVSRPLRDRRARNTDSALRLARRVKGTTACREARKGRHARSDAPCHPATPSSALENDRYAFGTGEPPLPAGDRTVLQLDGVTLHFVVESGALDAEKFGRLFLVTAALCKRLQNGGSLHVVESLYAAAR